MVNQIRFIRQTLYTLKRQYGFDCTFTRIVVNEKDYTTGIQSTTEVPYAVKRVIRLPDDTSRMTNLDFIFNKFSMSPKVEKHDRMFIVDARSLPTGYKPLMDDTMTIGNITYKILKIQELDYQLGYLITGEQNL